MFWNHVAVLKLIQVCRVILAQTYRGRRFVKLSHELFDQLQSSTAQITGAAPVNARQTAELIVRDFKAALAGVEIGDEAWAVLTDWITDGIYVSLLDLATVADDLHLAAQRLIDEREGSARPRNCGAGSVAMNVFPVFLGGYSKLAGACLQPAIECKRFPVSSEPPTDWPEGLERCPHHARRDAADAVRSQTSVGRCVQRG